MRRAPRIAERAGQMILHLSNHSYLVCDGEVTYRYQPAAPLALAPVRATVPAEAGARPGSFRLHRDSVAHKQALADDDPALAIELAALIQTTQQGLDASLQHAVNGKPPANA